MADTHLGQDADKLYTQIETFINNYEALKKNWDAASDLPKLPLEEAFKENCNLAVFVGTKDLTANDATYLEERKAVNAVLARGGNPFEELLKLFQKHAEAVLKVFASCKEISYKAFVLIGQCESQSAGQEGEMLKLAANIKKLLEQLSTAEAAQENQLAEYLRNAGGKNQSYELVKKQKASTDQEVQDCKNRIKRLEDEKDKLYERLNDGLSMDFGMDDEWGAGDAARAGFGTGISMQIDAKKGSISSEQAALPNREAHAAAIAITLAGIEENKTEREKATLTLKTAESHLKTIQVRLGDITKNSEALRKKLQAHVEIFTNCETHVGVILNKAELFQTKDVTKFDIKTRARLGNKVVAIVNEGVYFVDRPNVFLLLRQTLGAMEKANDLTGSEEEVKRLKDNMDLVNKLLNQSQTAIATGKHGSDLPPPMKLLEAE